MASTDTEKPPMPTLPTTDFTFQVPHPSNIPTFPSVGFTFRMTQPSVVLQALENDEVACKTHLCSPPTSPSLPLEPTLLAIPSKPSPDATGLFKFWQLESPAARLERDHREFEALRRAN